MPNNANLQYFIYICSHHEYTYVQGSLCANETLCTNKTNLKFNISDISGYIEIVLGSK